MKNLFLTQDFYLAATAMAKNFELVDYYRRGGFTTFAFNENAKLMEFIKDYYSESTLIEPVRHARAIKSLKSLIHSLAISTNKPSSDNEFANKRQES